VAECSWVESSRATKRQAREKARAPGSLLGEELSNPVAASADRQRRLVALVSGAMDP
jgi:hypothetical protein